MAILHSLVFCLFLIFSISLSSAQELFFLKSSALSINDAEAFFKRLENTGHGKLSMELVNPLTFDRSTPIEVTIELDPLLASSIPFGSQLWPVLGIAVFSSVIPKDTFTLTSDTRWLYVLSPEEKKESDIPGLLANNLRLITDTQTKNALQQQIMITVKLLKTTIRSTEDIGRSYLDLVIVRTLAVANAKGIFIVNQAISEYISETDGINPALMDEYIANLSIASENIYLSRIQEIVSLNDLPKWKKTKILSGLADYLSKHPEALKNEADIKAALRSNDSDFLQHILEALQRHPNIQYLEEIERIVLSADELTAYRALRTIRALKLPGAPKVPSLSDFEKNSKPVIEEWKYFLMKTPAVIPDS